jgi:hypothetical protein
VAIACGSTYIIPSVYGAAIKIPPFTVMDMTGCPLICILIFSSVTMVTEQMRNKFANKQAKHIKNL